MKENKWFIKLPIIIIFLIVIYAPVVFDVLNITEFERKDENRTFTDSVHISIHNLDNAPPQLNNYVNDNFAFRSPLLDLFHYIKFYVFKISPNPEKTIIGSDGWYFLAEKEKKIYEGKLDLDSIQLRRFEEIWTYRLHYLDSMNIKCYWLISPMKHYIYEEHLPMQIRKPDRSKRTFILKKHLNNKFPGLVIDPSGEFLSQKENDKLYYQLDNHWNHKAGYYASELLMSRIRKDFPDAKLDEITNYPWVDSTFSQGIHLNVIGIESLNERDSFPVLAEERSKLVYGYIFPVPDGFPYPWEFEKRYVNEFSSNDIKVVVIRDSFGASMIPFIKEPFMETLFIFDAWQYKLNKEIIERVKPDIVIYQSLETNHESFLEHN